MLPASNRGAGMNMGFPDVCNTIVGPATVPIPYPNIAMNAQAVPFSPIVKVSMMPALNMASMIPMTMGDEAGTAHPTIKGPSRYTMGNPIVFIDGQPGINLTCPTTGNNSNNALGAVLVPSAVNVFYCDTRGGAATRHAVDAELRGDVGWIALRALDAEAPARAHAAYVDLDARGARAVVLDLRGNGGGELESAIRIAEEALDEGDALATFLDGDGDETVVRARHPRAWRLPLVVVVDGGTASAAEVLAAALSDNDRAVLVGTATHGKGIATGVAESGDTLRLSSTVAVEARRRDGTPIQGRGLVPGVEAGDDDVEAVAEATARRLARG